MADTKARKPALERRTRSKARTARVTVSVLVIVNMTAWLNAQNGDAQAELQQRLASQFTVAKVTSDGPDTTANGALVELRKNGFMAYSVESPVPYLNNYDKKGHISQPFMANLGAGVAGGLAKGNKNYPTRFFRAGEKLWLVGLFVKKDGVTFRLYSDTYGAIRYYGDLKFPFDKGSAPASDEVLARISEALTARAVDNAGASAPTAGDQPQPPLAQVPPPPITPPPPPPDESAEPPKTISLGQSRDEVIAILGQPHKIAKIGTKEILYYKDLNVTLVSGKVSDAQPAVPEEHSDALAQPNATSPEHSGLVEGTPPLDSAGRIPPPAPTPSIQVGPRQNQIQKASVDLALVERIYKEVNLSKTKPSQRFGDITLILREADPHKQVYSVEIVTEDKSTLKRNLNVNEHVQFSTVTGGRTPYNLLINEVTRDSVLGHLWREPAELTQNPPTAGPNIQPSAQFGSPAPKADAPDPELVSVLESLKTILHSSEPIEWSFIYSGEQRVHQMWRKLATVVASPSTCQVRMHFDFSYSSNGSEPKGQLASLFLESIDTIEIKSLQEVGDLLGTRLGKPNFVRFSAPTLYNLIVNGHPTMILFLSLKQATDAADAIRRSAKICQSVPLNVDESAGAPNLTDIISVIKEKLTDNAAIDYRAVNQRADGSRSETTYSTRISNAIADISTCQIRFDQTSRINGGLGYSPTLMDTTGDGKQTISLRRVENIEVRPRQNSMPEVYTLLLRLSDGTSRGLQFEDRQVADQIAKAMLHAAELCKGVTPAVSAPGSPDLFARTSGTAFATNGRGLAALRQSGERNYIEFKIAIARGQTKQPVQVGDIPILLESTDPKHNRYTIKLIVDDQTVEKKDLGLNEPVQFMLSRARKPYELVVNDIKKDVIAGYISAPRVQQPR